MKARSVPPELMNQVELIVKALDEGRQIESVPAPLQSLFRKSVQPYEISWFKYDPARELAKLSMPVLLFQGTTDIQVSVDDAKLLANANPRAKLVVVDGMNHVLKQVPPDMDKQRSSYGDPSLPVAPQLVNDTSDWIQVTGRNCKRPASGN